MADLSALLNARQLKLADLARALKVDKATVTRWSQRGVPAERVAEVSKATGIAACDLRPDLAKTFARPDIFGAQA